VRSGNFQRPPQPQTSAAPKFAHRDEPEKWSHGLITSCNGCRPFKTALILALNGETLLLDTELIEELIWSRAEELSKQEKQKELDCVLKSATFARSEQLRSFLLYVCRMEMDGRAGDLNEYLVGVEALGRPASYSPAEDSSVRSRAWELRQKLLKLYGTERRDSPLRIDLPRGGYTPQYLVCAPGTDDEVHVQHEIALPERHGELTYPFPPLTRTSPRSSRRAALIGIFSGLAVALIVLGANYLWKARTTALDGIDPVIRQAWGPLLDPGSPDMLLMANGLYLLIRPNASPSFIASRKYKVPAEIYEEYQKKRPLAPDKKLMMFSSDNVVQMGYINGLVTVSGILQRTRQPFSTVPERVVTPSAIRNRNVILFGAPQDSTAATELLSTGAYHFSYDSVHDIVIRKGNIPRSDSPYYRTPCAVRHLWPDHGDAFARSGFPVEKDCRLLWDHIGWSPGGFRIFFVEPIYEGTPQSLSPSRSGRLPARLPSSCAMQSLRHSTGLIRICRL
jgi:hypothetical protein